MEASSTHGTAKPVSSGNNASPNEITYNHLKRNKLFDGDLDDFNNDIINEEVRRHVYSIMTNDKKFDGSFLDFTVDLGITPTPLLSGMDNVRKNSEKQAAARTRVLEEYDKLPMWTKMFLGSAPTYGQVFPDPVRHTEQGLYANGAMDEFKEEMLTDPELEALERFHTKKADEQRQKEEENERKANELLRQGVSDYDSLPWYAKFGREATVAAAPYANFLFSPKIQSIETDTRFRHPEYDAYNAAARMHRDARNEYEAPSRYGNGSGIANLAKGASVSVTDPDWYTRGGVELIDQLAQYGTLSKMDGILEKAEKEKWSSETIADALEKSLNDGDKSLLLAMDDLQTARLARQDDKSLAYQGGQGIAESMGYMFDFLATGSVTNAAFRKTAAAAFKSLRRRLLKGSPKALSAMSKTARFSYGAGKFGIRAADASVKTAARTPLMMSTWNNVMDNRLELDENGRFKNSWTGAIANGITDSFLENLSEMSGPAMSWMLSKGLRVTGKALKFLSSHALKSAKVRKATTGLLDKIRTSGLATAAKEYDALLKSLKELGYDGLVEEWMEEVFNAASMTAKGHITGDGDDQRAWSDFWDKDNQGILWMTLAFPILGGGGIRMAANGKAIARNIERERSYRERPWMRAVDERTKWSNYDTQGLVNTSTITQGGAPPSRTGDYREIDRTRGMVQVVRLSDGREVYVTNGHVETDEQGNILPDKSDKTLTVIDNNKKIVVPTGGTAIRAEKLVSSTPYAEVARSRAQSIFTEEKAKYTYKPGSSVVMVDPLTGVPLVNPDGTYATATVVRADDEHGGIILDTHDPSLQDSEVFYSYKDIFLAARPNVAGASATKDGDGGGNRPGTIVGEGEKAWTQPEDDPFKVGTSFGLEYNGRNMTFTVSKANPDGTYVLSNYAEDEGYIGSDVVTREQLSRLQAEAGGTQAPAQPQQSAQPAQGTQVSGQPQPSSLIGRSLTQEEAEALVEEMETRAETAPEMELTPENWVSQFGEDGMVQTPLGAVKMGENQISKLFLKNRTREFGMIKPTLENPDVIIEEYDPEDGAERDTKYLFIKTFKKANGGRIVHFESVTVQKEGLEVSISSHELKESKLKEKVQQDNLMHLDEKFLNSDGRLTEPRKEGPDLVPSPNSVSSTHKDTQSSDNTQDPVQVAIDDAVALVGEDGARQAVESTLNAKRKELENVRKKIADAVRNVDLTSPKSREALQKLKAKEAELRQTTDLYSAALERLDDQGQGRRQPMPQGGTRQAGEEDPRLVPVFTEDDPKKARGRGWRKTVSEMINRPGPVKALRGKPTSVKFSTKHTQGGVYAVVEADGLQPSHTQGQKNPYHFLDEAQPKDREGKDSVKASRDMAAGINPEEITGGVTAYTGSPSINARGEVIQGNNRSDALKYMYSSEPQAAARYRQYLIDHAADFGLDAEAVARMEHPVLVNLLDVADEDAIALGQYTQADLESGGIQAIPAQNAATLLANKGLFGRFANILLRGAEDEGISELVVRNGRDALVFLRNVAGAINDTQFRSAFRNDRGELTPEAKTSLADMLTRQLLGGNRSLQDMFRGLPAKAQKAIAATAFRDLQSPESERLQDELRASIVAFHALMQDPNFAAATNYETARRAMEAAKRQMNTDFATGSDVAIMEKFSNFALTLAALYKGSTQKQIQATFNDIYDYVQGTWEQGLFDTGTPTPHTLAESVKHVLGIEYQPINRNKNGHTRSDNVADYAPQGEAGGQGSPRNPGSGEQGTQGIQPTDGGRGAGSNGGEERVDNQGNPIDENGKLITEKANSIDDLTDEDFTNPTRSVELPQLPEAVSNAIGATGKPVVIKKNIFIKNKGSHGDLTPQDSREIIKTALYNPRLYGQNQPKSRPYNWILVRLADKHSFILIEVNDNKDNYEIVSWHYLDEETLQQKRNQADREGGQILTLSIYDNAAGNTSDNSKVSITKDTQSSKKKQGLYASEQWRKDIRKTQERIDELQKKVDKLRKEIEARTRFTEEEKKAKEKEFRDLLEQGRPLRQDDPRLEPLSKKIRSLQTLLMNWRERKEAAIQKELEKTEEYKALRKAQDDWGKIPGVRGTSVDDIMTAYEYGRNGYYAFIGEHPEAIKRAYRQGLVDFEAKVDNTNAVKAFAEKYQENAASSPRPQNRLGISPTGGVSPQERDTIDQAARDLAGKLGGNVVLVSSPARIPDSKTGKKVRSMIEKGTPVKGWYDTKTGKAYVYLPNAESEADVVQTIMHEAVAHKGLRGLLGQQGFDGLCDTVWSNMPLAEQLRILEYVTGKKFDTMAQFYQAATEKNRRAAADEWLASFAENARIENPTLWHKVVAAIRNALRSLGINLRLTENDILALLRSSYANLQQGEINTAGGKAGVRYKKQFNDNRSDAYKRDFLLNGEPVSSLTGDEFLPVEGKKLTDQVEEYFNSFGNKAVSPIFGKVTLDRNGADDSFAHGMGRKKAIAYAAVKDVIEKGILIDSDSNHKGRGYDSYVVAAPIEIGKEKYVCQVVITVLGNSKRFYLHEVTPIKNLQNQSFFNKGGSKAYSGNGDLANILQKIISTSDNGKIIPMSERFNEEVGDIRFRIATTAEEREIEERAKTNGTWLKAPNGKPTNLSPRQWVQVRTKAFKDWFGDWELAAKWRMINGIVPVSVDNYDSIGQKEAEAIFEKLENGKNIYDGREVEWVKKTVGKIMRHKGFDVSRLIPAIKEVYDNSVPMISEPEIKRDGHKEHPNFKGYHHYVGKIQADGKIYYVRFTVQEINTRRKDIVPNQLHSTFISDVEITSADTRVNSGNDPTTANTSTIIDTKLQKFLEEAMAAAENSSKVVDENGEPLVVYHGTTNDRETRTWNDKTKSYDTTHEPFTVFSRKPNGEKNAGFFFNSDADNAYGYGYNTYDVFLNMRNPYIIDAKGQSYSDINHNGKTHDSYDWANLAEKSGHDGLILNNVSDGVDFSALQTATTDYVAFSPNQIKSATDNTGGFSNDNDDIRFRKAAAGDAALTQEEAALRDALAERLQEAGIEVEYVSEARLQELSKLSGAKLEAKRKSEARRKRDEQNHAIDYVASLITGQTEKEARQERLLWEQQHRDLAKEIYDAVLQGNFNDVTLQKINKYIDESTPKNTFGRRISQRVPQKMERSLHEGTRTNAVDALFTRISESAVGDAGTKLARNRSEREGTKEIKKGLLKGWAIATGNWHTGIHDFTNDSAPLAQGRDSTVYKSKDGRHVIKFSKGKSDKRFSTDIDAANLFSFVFPNTAYDILGYGEIDGNFVTILQQPVVDIERALTEQERVDYMRSLGFNPINKENTAFSNGNIVVADIQKGNVVYDKDGNVSVLDADVKLHTKDIGGAYTYPPAATDTEQRLDSGQPTFQRDENPVIYGAAYKGKIYLNAERSSLDTPIHEYTHLWAEALRRGNRQEWDSIVDMLRGTPQWNETEQRYPELTTDDRIAEETLALYSGMRGAQRLREQQQKIASEARSIRETVTAMGAIARVKQALKRFWKNVADFLHIHYENIDEVADKVLSDMLDGVNPLVAEGQSIINRAKANGTYLKAPNGKPSNLSPRQWAAARTAAFKDKYGDWEKVARIEKLRNSKPIDIEYNGEYDLNRDAAKKWLKENIRGLYTNADTNEQIEISKVGINEVTAHGSQDIAHLKSLSSIPKMIENSIYIDEIPNAKENDKYDSYRYYVCGLNIDGDDYTAKIVVGVKGDRKYYDHRLTQIEKGNLINNLNGLSNSVAENQIAHVSDIKDKRLVSILQNNYTGQLDENGEPAAETVDEYLASQEAEDIHFRKAAEDEIDDLRQQVNNATYDNAVPRREYPEYPKAKPGSTVVEQLASVQEWLGEMRRIDAKLMRDFQKELEKNAGFFRKWYRRLADQAAPLEHFQKFVLQHGGTMTEETDAYNDLFASNGRITYQTIEFKEKYWKPLEDLLTNMARNIQLKGFQPTITLETDKGTELREATDYDKLTLYLRAMDIIEAGSLGLVERGAQGFQEATGMTAWQYAETIQGFYSTEELQLLYDKVKACTRFSLDRFHEEGMLEDAKYEALVARDHYVPQRGWEEDGWTATGKNGGNGKGRFQDALKKAEGRSSLAADPMPYIYAMALSSIRETEKNRTKRKFLNFVRDNISIGTRSGAFNLRETWFVRSNDKDGDGRYLYERTYVRPAQELFDKDKKTYEEIKETEKELKKLKRRQNADGEKIARMEERLQSLKNSVNVLRHVNPAREKGKGEQSDKYVKTLRVVENGIQYEISINASNEKSVNGIVDALDRTTGPKGDFARAVSRIIGWITRKLTALLTRFNPAFAAANFSRDLMTMFFTNWIEYGFGFAFKGAGNAFAVMRAVGHYARTGNFDGGSKYSRELQEFFENGGATGFSFMRDLSDLEKSLQKRVNGSRLRNATVDAFEVMSKYAGILTEISEISIRFATYHQSRQQGASVAEAVRRSKEVTTNFDRKGVLAAYLGPIYGFFNASVQGINRMYRLVRSGHAKGLAATAAAFFAFGFLNAMLNPDDPDDETYLTVYDRMTNLTIGNVKIPIAHFFRGFWGFGTQVALWMQGRTTAKSALIQGLTFMMGEMVPEQLNAMETFKTDEKTGRLTWDWKTGVLNLVPTALSPVAEMLANQNFMGGTVYGKPFLTSQEDVIPQTQLAKYGVNPALQAFTDWLANVSGGSATAKTNRDIPWLFDVNPSKLEHLIEGYSPGVLGLGLTIVGAVASQITGQDYSFGEFNPIGRFYRAYDTDRHQSSLYWKLRKKADRYHDDMAAYKKDKDNNPNSEKRFNEMAWSEKGDTYRATRKLLDSVNPDKKNFSPSPESIKKLQEQLEQWYQNIE